MTSRIYPLPASPSVVVVPNVESRAGTRMSAFPTNLAWAVAERAFRTSCAGNQALLDLATCAQAQPVTDLGNSCCPRDR